MDIIDESKNTQCLASTILEKNSTEYGRYILKNHFPSMIDGLKKVHRRIIWSTHDKQKRFSGLTLTGTTATIHPYNDVSIYETAVKMSQNFNTVFPLLNLIGKCGSYANNVAAASRYTDFELSEFCKDVFLRGVEIQTIPFELTESLIGFEPSFFIPRIPTGLISYSETIGFGFKSLTLAYPMEAVCDLVESYANHLDKFKNELNVKWDYSNLMNSFIPYFPIRNIIRNKKQLIKNYKLGNFNAPIIVDGVLNIVDDSSVLIVTIPFRNTILSMKETLINAMKNKDEFGKNIDYLPASSKKKEADILIKFRKNTDFFEMVEKLKSVIKFSSEFCSFNNFPIDGKIFDKSPIEVMKEWYKERYYSILGKKKYQQQKLINRKRQLEALMIVAENIPDIVDIIHKEDEAGCFKLFMEKYKLSFYQSKFIRNSKIHILAKTDIEKVKDEYESINNEIEILLLSFNKIHNEIINDAKFFRNNYPTPTDGSYCPEYLGYIVIKNKGILAFENFIEMTKLLNIFKNESKKAFLFPKKIKDITLINRSGNQIHWDKDVLIEKISNNVAVLFNVSDCDQTIILKNNNTFRLNGIKYTDALQCFYTKNKTFKSILENGNIIDVNIDDIPLRTNVMQIGNKTKSIYYFDSSKWKDNEEYLLFTHSTAANTKISVNRINKNTKSIVTYVDSVNTVLGLYKSTDENILLNLVNGFICHIKGKELPEKKNEFMYSKYKI